jgi:hypothetical protein
MRIEVSCLECGEKYMCSKRNTKIFGPVIDTVCPLCGEKTSKNYSAFIEAQCQNHTMHGYTLHSAKARAMITLARAISNIISNEESFQKKKK